MVDNVNFTRFVFAKGTHTQSTAEEFCSSPGAKVGFGQSPYASTSVVAEEIGPNQFRKHPATIYIATDDGNSFSTTIFGNRKLEWKFGRRIFAIGGGVVAQTRFIGAPAVVPCSLDYVNFFTSVLADVAGKKPPCEAIEGKAPGIAQPKCPNFVGTTPAYKGVRRWNRV